MATSIESVVNQALVDIGYPTRIGSILEGTAAATAALEVFGQARDELLDKGEWPLARRANVPLTLLKGPPPAGGYNPGQPWSAIYPPPGFLYEYLYPEDAVTFLAILRPPRAMFELDPKPAPWRVDNDNSLVDRNGMATGQQKVILSNWSGALGVYTGRVVDPNLWEPGFIATLVDMLGQRLSRRLRVGEQVERQTAAEAMADGSRAAQDRG